MRLRGKHFLSFSTILLIVVTLFFAVSCKKGSNEGVIEYDIKFNEEERKKNEIIDLLPNTLKYYFKEKSSVSEISYMGIFKTAYISNVQEQSNTIIFYFMPNKYFTKTLFGQKTIGFDPMPGIQLQETGETKEIKGIKAYKVHVTFENDSMEPYDIWYTKDFKVHNPNWHTPYKEINGVLLDYRIKMKGISMHLTMNKFSDIPVDSSKFAVPKSYKKVSVDEMDQIFDTHLNMF